MSKTGLAATTLSLIATLAACGTNAQPSVPRPEAAESSSYDDPSVTETGTSTGSRPLTYSEDFDHGSRRDFVYQMRTMQYGGRTLRPGVDAAALDLTDDGLVILAPDGGVHFTDGETTEQVGESAAPDGYHYPDMTAVKTSSSGSLAAWFTPEGRDRSLVVYDTHQQRVLTQVPATHCQPHQCQLTAVVGEHVYWSEEPGPNWSTTGRWLGRPLMMLAVPDGTVSETDVRALAADLRSHPRGFIKGHSYDTGEVVNQDINDEAVFFVPRGSTLELSRVVGESGTKTECNDEDDGTVIYCYGGFDTTGRRLNLRLPADYPPAEIEYVLFQWLDDDRFAVMAGAARNFGLDGESGYGDILVCDIARERCTLAVPGPDDGSFHFRLVPHLVLPN